MAMLHNPYRSLSPPQVSGKLIQRTALGSSGDGLV